MKLDETELRLLLSTRVYLYQLLHEMLGAPVSPESLVALSQSSPEDILHSYLSVAETAAGAAPSRANDALSALSSALERLRSDQRVRADDFKALKVSYDAAFNIPGEAFLHPWASTYESKERTLFNESTAEIRRFYHAKGFALEAESHFPEDHIAALCHFASQHTRDILGILEGEGPNAALAELSDQARFLAKHLGSWVKDLRAKAHGLDTDQPYLAFIDFAEAMVSCDMEIIGSLG